MQQIYDALTDFTYEQREMYDDNVPRLISPPTSEDFYFEYISQNRPVIIQNAINHWPALTKWKTNEYLIKNLPDKITVAITPNGRADAVNDNYFCMPQEIEMTFEEFTEKVSNNNSDTIYYIQHQNNNFSDQAFANLWSDVESDLIFATDSFRCKPDVMNIWIGTHQSVSSLHKDPYENIYAVITGKKVFRLLPPASQPWLHEQFYKQAIYNKTESGWEIKPLDQEPIPWIPIDLGKPDLVKYPLLQHVNPITVTVHAGEVLYLPALWYHQVEQQDDEEGRCIAINYWYDSALFMKLHTVHDLITKISRTLYENK